MLRLPLQLLSHMTSNQAVWPPRSRPAYRQPRVPSTRPCLPPTKQLPPTHLPRTLHPPPHPSTSPPRQPYPPPPPAPPPVCAAPWRAPRSSCSLRPAGWTAWTCLWGRTQRGGGDTTHAGGEAAVRKQYRGLGCDGVHKTRALGHCTETSAAAGAPAPPTPPALPLTQLPTASSPRATPTLRLLTS
jgi:hypothetical protein